MSKSLFKSRVFWFNVLSVSVAAATGGLVPPVAAVPIVSVGNVLLRLITTQPAHLVPPKA